MMFASPAGAKFSRPTTSSRNRIRHSPRREKARMFADQNSGANRRDVTKARNMMAGVRGIGSGWDGPVKRAGRHLRRALNRLSGVAAPDSGEQRIGGATALGVAEAVHRQPVGQPPAEDDPTDMPYAPPASHEHGVSHHGPFVAVSIWRRSILAAVRPSLQLADRRTGALVSARSRGAGRQSFAGVCEAARGAPAYCRE